MKHISELLPLALKEMLLALKEMLEESQESAGAEAEKGKETDGENQDDKTRVLHK